MNDWSRDWNGKPKGKHFTLIEKTDNLGDRTLSIEMSDDGVVIGIRNMHSMGLIKLSADQFEKLQEFILSVGNS